MIGKPYFFAQMGTIEIFVSWTRHLRIKLKCGTKIKTSDDYKSRGELCNEKRDRMGEYNKKGESVFVIWSDRLGVIREIFGDSSGHKSYEIAFEDGSRGSLWS
jgi:hypothetical protein